MEPPIGEERLAPVNGIEIAYQEIGDAAGTPLLLAMGFATQMIHWDEGFCRLLAERGFRVIRFDNRDIGHSTKFDAGAPAYGLSDMAADTVGLLDHLEIERAHLVGASMGGMISQLVAIEWPERVASLCSIMSTTGDPTVGQPTPVAIATLSEPPEESREGYGDASVQISRVIGSPAYPADEEQRRELGRRCWDRSHDPAGLMRQLQAITTAPDRTEALGRLQIPVLVIHGAEDPLISVSGGEATARAIPGARLEVFAGMGHDLPPALWPTFVEQISANASAALAARAQMGWDL
jgi:pimeloyl-ACP methyl ester carboxylesterase